MIVLFIVRIKFVGDFMSNENENILKKSFISSIIFILIVIVVFYFIFRDNNYREVYKMVAYSNKFYLLCAILCMASFSICEAINIKISFNLLGDKISFKNCYKYALAGFFVASITPSSSGGDPMQLYLMAKDDIKVSHGALTLLLKLLSFQLIVVLFGITSFIFSGNTFLHALGNLKFIVFLGTFLNILVGTLYFLIIFFKGIVTYLVVILEKILRKLHVKITDKIINKINSMVDEYSKASDYLKQNKLVLLKIFLTTAIQMSLYYSIPYFVYLALGFDNYSILTFISFQSILFISVSTLPFPGAVGVSEAAFMKIYKSMFPKKILGSAMVISRFINFYIFVLYSGIVLIIYILKSNFKSKR